ncbi:MAG: DUF4493 domain-containing protein [Bacteroidales bacterium]|nr:DUF4493 domain-containing protein [Bacteroidales bacterium]
MKKCLLILSLLAFVSCRDFLSGGKEGELFVSIENEDGYGTRSGLPVPSVDDFILVVEDSRGKEYYRGLFKDSPETISVPAGTYTVSAFSSDFDTPQYDCPQYGDTQVVVVQAGSSVAAKLSCSQINSGIRLNIHPDFRTLFPNALLYLKSDDGMIMFAYTETRIAFFNPGQVSVVMKDGGVEYPLFNRVLEAGRILEVNLTASSDLSASGGVSVRLDTTRTWISESVVYGSGGGTYEDALSVPEARELGEMNDVWVYGFIVGSFASTGKAEFNPPFSKSTNILLSSRSSVSDSRNCISVELKSGEIRDALNLVDHPENLGGKVCLHGNLVSSYYGLPGLKSLSGYEWK